MNSPHPDPLSTEERELAAMLSRLGPQGEPSAALDARILAASHEATAGKPAVRKPRWPVAFGIAASMVFAVGIAWQLRPSAPVVASSEVPAADLRPAAPMQDAMQGPAIEKTAPIATQAAPAEPASANVADSAMSASRESIPEPATPAPAMTPRQSIADAPAPRSQTAQAKAAAPPQRSSVPAPSAATAAPPPPPAPATPARVRLEGESPAAFMPDQEDQVLAETAIASDRAAAAALDAGTTQRRELPMPSMSPRQAEERTTLDRVQVTGSRIRRTDLQVPVADDAQLQVDDWLERVRTRYGLGDAAAARQSLLLFVKDHPEENVPDDLEPLLDE